MDGSRFAERRTTVTTKSGLLIQNDVGPVPRKIVGQCVELQAHQSRLAVGVLASSPFSEYGRIQQQCPNSRPDGLCDLARGKVPD